MLDVNPLQLERHALASAVLKRLDRVIRTYVLFAHEQTLSS